MKSFLFLLIICFGCTVITAQDKPALFTGGKVITVTGQTYEQGYLLIHKGKIVAAGPMTSVPDVTDATVVDCSGKVLMPGIVDTHSHIGSVEGGDGSSATHPDVRVLDSIDPLSDSFWRARAGGITTVNIMPGSGHLMSGQTAYVKTKRVSTIEEMLITLDNGLNGGMKMANGTNSKGSAPFPGTRSRSASIIRQLFLDAQDYKKKIDAAGKDATKLPKRNLQFEALNEVLSGARVVHHHTHRADDIMTVLRLKKEFGFNLVLQHVTEGYKVAKEIAEAGVPCSIILVDSPGGKLEIMDFTLNNAVMLDKAGVKIAFHTDDYITDSRLLLRSAGLAIRAGLSEHSAIAALTINGASMMSLEKRIGSLEKGKDADFLILSGNPFSIYTKVEQTWIEGSLVYDMNRDKEFATGGFRVYKTENTIDNCGREDNK